MRTSRSARPTSRRSRRPRGRRCARRSSSSASGRRTSPSCACRWARRERSSSSTTSSAASTTTGPRATFRRCAVRRTCRCTCASAPFPSANWCAAHARTRPRAPRPGSSELVWREFYQMILWHHPHVVDRAFRPEYDRIAWETGPQAQEELPRVVRGPHRLPDRRRRHAPAEPDRLHAQPAADDHGELPHQGPRHRLAPRRALLRAAPQRLRPRREQRRMAVGRVDRLRRAAVLPHLQSGDAVGEDSIRAGSSSGATCRKSRTWKTGRSTRRGSRPRTGNSRPAVSSGGTTRHRWSTMLWHDRRPCSAIPPRRNADARRRASCCEPTGRLLHGSVIEADALHRTRSNARGSHLLRLNGRRGTSLRARRGGRHSARRCSLRAGRLLSVALPRRRWCLAAVPTRPAALAQLVRPPPDGRCARHATTRPGAAPCGQGRTSALGVGVGLGCPGELPRCGRLVGPGRPASDRIHTRGAPSALWGASRSATPCGGRRIPETAAGRDEHRPEGTTGGTARAHSESCRPARSALDPVSPAARRAESRRPAARSTRRRLCRPR